MRFTPTAISGVTIVDIEPHTDERGLFARTWCVDELAAAGLDTRVHQCSTSVNHRRGTLRGLHWQAPPHGEVKLVRCTAGAIWDVVADVRPGSPTFGAHVAVELSADNRRALHIAEGLAHGFLTLTDGAEVLYMISAPYVASAARGVRWDDPDLAIPWPAPPTVISAADAARPRLADL